MLFVKPLNNTEDLKINVKNPPANPLADILLFIAYYIY